MPRRKRQTAVNIDPANALRALIAKYRRYPDLTDFDLTDINRQTYGDEDALLHYVARYGGPDEVSLLVSCGANLNPPGDMGYTPLHYAAMWGKLDNVTRLLELGADVGIKDAFGATAEIVAEVGAQIHPDRKKDFIKIARLLKKAAK